MGVSRKFSFLKIQTEPLVWDSFERLVKKFYGVGVGFSRVTSSHWEKYGETQEAEMDHFTLTIEGLGFGDYENKKNLRVKDRIKDLITIIASKLMIYSLPNQFRRAVNDLAQRTDRVINQDFIRLAKSAEKIVQHVEIYGSKRVLIIGDGWGTLGCILKELRPELQIVQVNLGRSLLFDLAFSSKALRHCEHRLIDGLSEVMDQDFSYLPAEKISLENANIDLFIAIESFQEMDIEIVNDYFELIRGQEVVSYLYSANRLSKTLPDGSVIRKKDYGWSFQDKVIFEHTPWWLNWGIRRRPPFLFRMDGIIEETLVQISNKS